MYSCLNILCPTKTQTVYITLAIDIIGIVIFHHCLVQDHRFTARMNAYTIIINFDPFPSVMLKCSDYNQQWLTNNIDKLHLYCHPLFFAFLGVKRSENSCIS